MSNELREIIKRYNCCGDCSFCNYSDGSCESAGGKLWEMAIKKIKKWVISRCPEKGKFILETENMRYNQALANYVKNIEEG